jgi:hypothetical protein
MVRFFPLLGGSAVALLIVVLVALPAISPGPSAGVATARSFHSGLPRGALKAIQPWFNVTNLSVSLPQGRNGSALTYDTKDGYVLEFGGLSPNGTLLGDTWSFRGGNWSQIVVPPGVGPSPRAFSSMTYDPVDQAVLLFGGTDNATVTDASKLNDTWEFANGSWTQLHPSLSPPARYAASIAYDVKDGYALLFGGNTTHGPAADSWAFAAGTWSRLATGSGNPLPRYGAAMGYDPSLLEVILSGGRGLAGHVGHELNQTWAFQSGNWSFVRHEPGYAAKPYDRFGAVIASSPNATILVGGTEGFQQRIHRGHSVGVGNWALLPFYFLGSGHWYGQRAAGGTPAGPPPVSMPDQFPGFTWDGADGYFVLVVDGTTWITA